MRACVVALVVMLGCASGARDAAAPLSSTSTLPPMFAHVPADAPYVIGVIGVNQHLRAQMYEAADRRLAEALALLQQVPQELDRSTLEPWMRAVLVLADEMRGKDVERWTREIGLDPTGQLIVYGAPLWPVARISLTDATKLRQLARRVLAASGMTLEEGALQGHTYWLYRAGKSVVVAAILDRELVLAMVPPAEVTRALPLVLGIEKPRRSLRDVPTVTQLIARHQLLPAMVGYVDVRALAKTMMSQATAAAPGACGAEVERLVAHVPRFVFGYRALDAQKLHFRTVAEVSAPVREALAGLRTSVPSLPPGPTGAPIVSLSVAARLEGVVALAQQASRHALQMASRCEWFEPLRDGFTSLDRMLARPLPLGLRPLEGFAFVVDDITTAPLAVSARALVVGAGANTIVTSFMNDVLGATGFQLAGDASLMPIPLQPFGIEPPTTAHLTASGSRASLAVGTASAAAATAGLSAPAPRRSPLVTLGIDLVRWKELGFNEDDDFDLRSMILHVDVEEHGLVLDAFGRFP